MYGEKTPPLFHPTTYTPFLFLFQIHPCLLMKYLKPFLHPSPLLFHSSSSAKKPAKGFCFHVS